MLLKNCLLGSQRVTGLMGRLQMFRGVCPDILPVGRYVVDLMVLDIGKVIGF